MKILWYLLDFVFLWTINDWRKRRCFKQKPVRSHVRLTSMLLPRWWRWWVWIMQSTGWPGSSPASSSCPSLSLLWQPSWSTAGCCSTATLWSYGSFWPSMPWPPSCSGESSIQKHPCSMFVSASGDRETKRFSRFAETLEPKKVTLYGRRWRPNQMQPTSLSG